MAATTINVEFCTIPIIPVGGKFWRLFVLFFEQMQKSTGQIVD